MKQLSMNEDFSFVRFLKVVKTLYESSTFTQLGRTVGSALNPLSPPSYEGMGEESRKSSPRKSRKKADKPTSPSSESVFDVLSDFCSPPKERRSFDDQSTIARKDTLFEQAIKGCTLLSSPVAEEFSDEDTFKTRTEEEDLSYYSEGESFETMEDDYSSPRHRRSKRRH